MNFPYYNIRGINHYILKKNNRGKLHPFLLANFYLDIFDHHSGKKISKKFFVSAPLIEVDAEITWDGEMFNEENPHKLKKIEVEFCELDFIPSIKDLSEEKFDQLRDILYSAILKFFKIKLYRNRFLNTYSEMGENKEEFMERCKEKVRDFFEPEFEGLRKITEIKFEQLTEIFTKKEYINEFEREKVRDSFFEAKRYLEKLFLSKKISPSPEIPLSNDAKEYLSELIDLTLKKFKEIEEKIEKNYRDIEIYRINLVPKNISDFRVDILWK